MQKSSTIIHHKKPGVALKFFLCFDPHLKIGEDVTGVKTSMRSMNLRAGRNSYANSSHSFGQVLISLNYTSISLSITVK